MAEYLTIQERVVSGRGVLKFEALAQTKYRRFLLYYDVIRFPSNRSINRNYNPSKSFYGTCVFLKDNYVVFERKIEYPAGVFEFTPDIAGQSLIGLICATDLMLAATDTIAVAVQTTTSNLQNTLKEYKSLAVVWDTMKVVCYGEAGIRFRLRGVKYDTCDEAYDDSKDDDDPPSPEPGKVPTPEPLVDDNGVSPAYDAGDDGGDTAPYPGDIEAGGCPPLVWHRVTYSTIPIETFNDYYFRLRADDVPSFSGRPDGNCYQGSATDMLVNGDLGYEYFSCSVQVIGADFTVLPEGEQPPEGALTFDTLLYPGCKAIGEA